MFILGIVKEITGLGGNLVIIWSPWVYGSKDLVPVTQADSCVNVCFFSLQAPRMLVSQYLTKESK